MGKKATAEKKSKKAEKASKYEKAKKKVEKDKKAAEAARRREKAAKESAAKAAKESAAKSAKFKTGRLVNGKCDCTGKATTGRAGACQNTSGHAVVSKKEKAAKAKLEKDQK